MSLSGLRFVIRIADMDRPGIPFTANAESVYSPLEAPVNRDSEVDLRTKVATNPRS